MTVRRLAILALLVVPLGACRKHRRAPPAPPAVVAQVAAAAAPVEETVDPDELLPGPTAAFGLSLPLSTQVRFESNETRMYYIPAEMPRVMRYLQQHLDYTTADIHPLGAMIRNARLREHDDSKIFDVGVRDEGTRTLVTLWDRTPIPQVAPRSMDDALRAAGIDPTTRQTMPRYNR